MRTNLLVLAGLVVAGVAAAGCDRSAGPGAVASTSTVPAAPSRPWPCPRAGPSTPPKGDRISVLATATEPPAPATPCRPVLVGRLEGSRCQDAEATLVITTLKGQDRWFVLEASLQRAAAPAGAYDRVLASFRLS